MCDQNCQGSCSPRPQRSCCPARSCPGTLVPTLAGGRPKCLKPGMGCSQACLLPSPTNPVAKKEPKKEEPECAPVAVQQPPAKEKAKPTQNPCAEICDKIQNRRGSKNSSPMPPATAPQNAKCPPVEPTPCTPAKKASPPPPPVEKSATNTEKPKEPQIVLPKERCYSPKRNNVQDICSPPPKERGFDDLVPTCQSPPPNLDCLARNLDKKILDGCGSRGSPCNNSSGCPSPRTNNNIVEDLQTSPEMENSYGAGWDVAANCDENNAN